MFEYVVFTNFTFTGFNYIVNNYHAVTVVLEEARLKMRTDPVPNTY